MKQSVTLQHDLPPWGSTSTFATSTSNLQPEDSRISTRWQLYVAVTGLCAAQFSSFLSLFILSPFFLAVCDRRGLSGIEQGAMVGTAQIAGFFTSYSFLGIIHRGTLKLQIFLGLTVAGLTQLCFAYTNAIESNTWFLVTCLVLRTIQGAAVSVTNVVLIIGANKISPCDKVATVMGFTEMSMSLANALSPLLGGSLYQIGDYSAPFWTSAALLILTAVVTVPTIPRKIQIEKKSVIRTLRDTSKVSLYYIQFLISGIFMGFFGGMVEPHLRQFDLSPTHVGAVILVTGFFSGLAGPTWGYICDRSQNQTAVLLVSVSIGCTGLLLFGPFPGIPVPRILWIVVLSLALCGTGTGGFVISTISQARNRLLKICDSEDDCNTVLSTCLCSTAGLGCFIGTMLGGMLTPPTLDAALVAMLLFAVLVQALMVWERTPREKNHQKVAEACGGATDIFV